jgi:hypothetical protein
MMTWALFSELSKLSHISVEFQGVHEPLIETQYDFVLCHCCFGEPMFEKLIEIRKHTKYKTILFMEIPVKKEYIDYCFTYLPPADRSYCEEISLPCLSDVLDKHNKKKTSGTILLDHIWAPYWGTEKELSPQLHQWLGDCREQFTISQLKRSGCENMENFPDWITPLPEKRYVEYLDATAHFNTYILTHPGSYEHSVIDMVYRGTRTLVPVINGVPFIPRATIDKLDLETFSNKDELLLLLNKPITVRDRRKMFTSMTSVANRIDSYCRRSIIKPP